jgi:hypothetical protein
MDAAAWAGVSKILPVADRGRRLDPLERELSFAETLAIDFGTSSSVYPGGLGDGGWWMVDGGWRMEDGEMSAE